MPDGYFGRGLTLPQMRELSVTEQRHQAILAVIRDGRTVTEVASEWRVSRQTMHTWPRRDGRSPASADRSKRKVVIRGEVNRVPP